MLQITIANRLLPQKGNVPDCSRLGKRVKSATCADGCVTAANAANRQAKSRGRTIPLRCSPSFPTPFPTKVGARADSPTLRLSRRRLIFQSLSLWPRLEAGKNRHNSGATVTVVAAVAAGAIGRQQPPSNQHNLPRFPVQVVQPARPPKPKRSGDAAEPAAQQPQAAQSSKQPKGAVVLSIGLPGSGKSTWFKRHSILPLSSDMVRILLFDDVTEQRYQDLVFSTLRTMLRARLLARRPWNYLDATNLSPHERRSWIKLAHDFGYEAHAVFFDVPPEVCMERNHRRERNVPEDVMQRMANKLRPPKFEEGFAKITVVRLKKKDGEAAAAEEPRQEFAIEPDEGEPPEVVDTTE